MGKMQKRKPNNLIPFITASVLTLFIVGMVFYINHYNKNKLSHNTTEGGLSTNETENSTTITQAETEETDETLLTGADVKKVGNYAVVNHDIPQLFIKASSVSKQAYSECTIYLVDTDASYDEAVSIFESATVKYRGKTSYSASKKSYNFKLEEAASLLGMDSGKKWSLIANPFDKSLLRQELGFKIGEILDLPYTTQCEFVELWFNGVYKGVYMLVTPVTDGRLDLDTDNGDFILECEYDREESGVTYIETGLDIRYALDTPDDASDEQVESITNTINAIESAIRTCDHSIYEQYIDVDSFVNMFIAQEIIKNVDYSFHSTRYFYKNGKLYAGPLWDLDLTMGNVTMSNYTVYSFMAYHNLQDYYYPPLEEETESSVISDENAEDESETTTEQTMVRANSSDDGTESETETTEENRGYIDYSKADSTIGQWARYRSYFSILCNDSYFMSLVSARIDEVYEELENLASDNALGTSYIGTLLSKYEDAFCRNYEDGGWSLTRPYLTLNIQTYEDNYISNATYLQDWLVKRVEWLNATY